MRPDKPIPETFLGLRPRFPVLVALDPDTALDPPLAVSFGLSACGQAPVGSCSFLGITLRWLTRKAANVTNFKLHDLRHEP